MIVTLHQISLFQEADRQICASSVLHQADQTCRRLVSQVMASARGASALYTLQTVSISDANFIKYQISSNSDSAVKQLNRRQ